MPSHLLQHVLIAAQSSSILHWKQQLLGAPDLLTNNAIYSNEMGNQRKMGNPSPLSV